jgi:hypothetical protein
MDRDAPPGKVLGQPLLRSITEQIELSMLRQSRANPAVALADFVRGIW